MSLSAKFKNIYGAAIERAAARNLPTLAALLMLFAFRTVKPAKAVDARTVVILPKLGFTPDIMMTLAAADQVKVVVLPRIVVKYVAGAFLPYFVDDSNYTSCGAEFDEAKLRYRAFWIAALRRLRRYMRIDAMITGNFSYAAERELAAAMQEAGIPFIALHKENLKTPGLEPFFEKLYRERRGQFTGRKILVYNRIERDLQIRAGVVEPSRVEIVGMPRLDLLHAWRRANVGAQPRGRILFFAFSPATGMPRIFRKGPVPGEVYAEEAADDSISLSNLAEATYATVLQLARDNPDISVVVKTKGRSRDITETNAMFGVRSASQLPSNMQLVHGGDIVQLIAEASVICGFNSTVLLEAIAAGKPVVLPWFGEVEAPEVWSYLIDLRSVSAVATSPESLRDELVRGAKEPKPIPAELDAESRQILGLWTGNDDGGAASRAREAILRELA
jgi:hypothetical protein